MDNAIIELLRMHLRAFNEWLHNQPEDKALVYDDFESWIC